MDGAGRTPTSAPDVREPMSVGVEAEHHGRRDGVLAFLDSAHGRAHGEELDAMLTPDLGVLAHPDTDDAGRLIPFGFGLHTSHRDLARVVRGLCEVRHLEVSARLLHDLADALVSDVIHAAAQHERHRRVPRLPELQEVRRGSLQAS